MAMRDLVTGAAACAVPGSSAASNPLGAFANSMLASSSMAQELKELPGSSATASNGRVFSAEAPFVAIPGSEHENQRHQLPDVQNSQFLRGFHSADHGGLVDAWNDVQWPPPTSLALGRPDEAHLAEFEQIYDHAAGAYHGPIQEGPPQRALFGFLHSFVHSSLGDVPFGPKQLPLMGLSKGDKQCIRDRSCIMARHIFADKSEEYINSQVNSLLHSLEIDSDDRLQGPLRGMPPPELEQYWNESQASLRPGAIPGADRWVAEYGQRVVRGDPGAWADSFEQQHGVNGWASEFQKEQVQMGALGHVGARDMNLASMEQTRMLAETLNQNSDPKFQNSKFLQFLSKMSRGDLIVGDNQIKPAAEASSSGWANEFQTQYNAGPSSWADQFAQDQLSHGANQWVQDFSNVRKQEVDDQWVSEFSKLNIDWADEFGRQVGEGAFGDSSADNWAEAYDTHLNEQSVARQGSESSRGVYVFSDMNPYVGHPDPLQEGQELFRKGLLSEAVLALEAEVLKNPDNAEGWRLLGITHAENDDDQQAIASMRRALEADPTNLEVLLSLGVSHTNELEQGEALKHLYGWLQNHAKYASVATLPQSEFLYYGDVTRLFNEASQMSPEDADVLIVLGVLYNLSREYDKAIASFERALKLKPHDYSLWNKLGATQANSVQSADAILAYQQALDLKPNYVRAWANMGISYANQGLYEDSVRYYVRALAMNPKADTAWQYLRISLSCASRNDMLEACDSRNIDLLQKEFPL